MCGKVKIEVPKEVREKIIKVFGVSNQTENGGQRMAYWPECETIHDEVGGVMVQTFANGAVLTIDKHSGDAKVDYKGSTRMRQENISVRELYVIQEFAAAI